MQIREDENLPSAATTAVARVLGQKIKSESGRDEQKKKRFFCKGLRDNFVILNFEFPLFNLLSIFTSSSSSFFFFSLLPLKAIIVFFLVRILQ